MRKLTKLVIVVVVGGLFLVSCASLSEKNNVPQSGFLSNYSELKPVNTGDSDISAYIYRQPGIKRSNYDKLIVSPVVLYQTASESGVSLAQIESASQVLHSDIESGLANQITITDKPGKRTARISLAITGAVIEKDSFKPRYLIPISAIIQLSSRAAGVDSKQAVLVIETKVTDSLSNQMLGAAVTIISSEKFRLESSTPKEFMHASRKWVAQAVKYATENQSGKMQ